VRCSECCCGGRDLDVERDDRDGEAVDEVSNGLNSWLASASGANQGLGEGGCCEGEMVTVLQGVGEGCSGRLVVRVAGVEEPDDDAGVKMDQSHSRRSSSSSLAVYAPVIVPANSARMSCSRSRTTRPAPSAWATTRSPISRPAARNASAGIVI